MTEKITLELPVELAHRVRAIAAEAHQPVETLLVQWVGQAATEPPLEALSDADILSLCNAQLDGKGQAELSELLARSRESELAVADRSLLDALMQSYREGLIRKAQAWKIAASRQIRGPLN